jgi:hypothetical protein
MCVILGKVATVAKTKLLVAPSLGGARQLTVYANAVTSLVRGNAMVLPVPHPETLAFHDLSGYATLFDDCAACFERPLPRSIPDGARRSAAGSRPALAVVTVGSYHASVVPSLDDFDRLDASLLRVPANVGALLAATYAGRPFGFIVCALREGAAAYHPFAYSHALETAGTLFVPTLHAHEHEHGDGDGADGGGRGGKARADWDHTIHVVGGDDAQWLDAPWTRAAEARLDTAKLPAGFLLDPAAMGLRRIKGAHPNVDLTARFAAAGGAPSAARFGSWVARRASALFGGSR